MACKNSLTNVSHLLTQHLLQYLSKIVCSSVNNSSWPSDLFLSALWLVFCGHTNIYCQCILVNCVHEHVLATLYIRFEASIFRLSHVVRTPSDVRLVTSGLTSPSKRLRTTWGGRTNASRLGTVNHCTHGTELYIKQTNTSDCYLNYL